MNLISQAICLVAVIAAINLAQAKPVTDLDKNKIQQLCQPVVETTNQIYLLKEKGYSLEVAEALVEKAFNNTQGDEKALKRYALFGLKAVNYAYRMQFSKEKAVSENKKKCEEVFAEAMGF